MDAMQAIIGRRSVRRYTEEDVSDAEVHKLLEAAMYAPSAGNERPWHFVVIRERRILEAIPDHHPYAKMVKSAPVAVLICGAPELELHEGFWPIDCAAATQNILLAAHAQGLGTVWLGVYPLEDRMRALASLLGLPDGIVPFALVPVGHPAEERRAPERFLPDRVHRDGW